MTGIAMTSGAVVMSFTASEWMSPLNVTAVAIGAFAGWIITPDLDVQGRTYEEKRFYNWHPLIGFLWQAYWYVYAKFMKHRGVSHWPFVGTLTRWGYMFIPLVMMAVGLNLMPSLNWEWVGMTFLVWAAQDIVHGTLDVLYSSIKRTF